MSDTVLIALIGVVGTALSGIVVAVVSGWIYTRSTRLQLDAHRAEVSQQIRSQQEESRRGRIIEARKGYLIPFRDSLSSWIDTSLSADSAFLALQYAVQAKSDPSPLVRDLEGRLMHAQETLSELWKYLRQTSDATLFALVNDLWDSEEKASEGKKELAEVFFQLGVRAVNNDVDTQSFKGEFDRAKAKGILMVKQRQEKLATVNKRIEELLAGDESV
jgi:hypothetical protein